MTNAIAVIDEPAKLVPFSVMSDEQRLMLKQVCAGTNLNDQQFGLLCEIGIRTGLDPLRRQIYGLIFDGKFQVFTGIDGFRAVARRNGLAGIDEPHFEYIDEQKRIPSSCSITVYRWGRGGEKESYTARGLFREYARYTRDGKLQKNWAEKPHLMLAKCVEALAHRMAFTEWMGGVYERDEFPREDQARVRQASQAPRDIDDVGTKPILDVEVAGASDEDMETPYTYDPDPTAKDAP